MECHKCRITAEIEAGIWKDTPFEETACAQCQLADDSRGTMAYREADPANAAWDHSPDDETLEAAQLADGQSSAPFEHLDPGDPSVPLSVLADAMSLWMSLSLPARKVFQMRMQKLPYSAIGERLGCSRQAAEKLVAQAIA